MDSCNSWAHNLDLSVSFPRNYVEITFIKAHILAFFFTLLHPLTYFFLHNHNHLTMTMNTIRIPGEVEGLHVSESLV